MRRVGIFIVMCLALLGIGGRGRVLAVGCEVVVIDIEDPSGSGNWIQINYDGCGGNWNYCDSGFYRAPDGTCHAIGGGSDTPVRNPPDCAWNPIDCPADRIKWDTYTDSVAGRIAGCPLGTAQRFIGSCQHDNGLGSNDPEYICFSRAVRTYACCAEGTTASCPIVNRNSTYQANNPEDGYDTFARTTQVVTSQRWGQTGWYCVREEDGVCLESAGVYGWIYTYGTTNVYNDFDIVCTCASSCTSTAPTNLSVTQGASATAAMLSWRSGTGGTSQSIYVGTNQTSVNNNCASGGCIISGATVSPFLANTN
ncbi:MAG: hypothetical protein RIR73_2406 [Chloroflexota bacterium]|jgi:hypothetical protein